MMDKSNVFLKRGKQKKHTCKKSLSETSFLRFFDKFQINSCPSKGTLQKPGEDTEDIDVSDVISTSIVNDPIVDFRNVDLSLFCQGSSNYPRIGGGSNNAIVRSFWDFYGFPWKKLVHSLGWCHIMTPLLVVLPHGFFLFDRQRRNGLHPMIGSVVAIHCWI